MNCYCDSSFFLRQLVPSSLRADAIEAAAELATRSSIVPLTTLVRFEVIQALRFEAWRNRNDHTKGLPAAQVNSAMNLFIAEVGEAYEIVDVNWDDVHFRAEQLSRSTPENGWRAFDVLHVASALNLGAKAFYSYDGDQNELARRAGLETPLRVQAK
jgi:predicted nucleic acid-binding protein